jgi:site-specific recombinase XerD
LKNKNGKLFFSMTFEYLDIYMAKQMGRSPATIKTYRDALSLFRKFVHEILGFSIASFEFSQCTRECVFGFMDWLKSKGSKPGSRNQRLAAIKSYLWFASDKDVFLQLIALEVKRVPQCKDPKTDKRALTTEELSALFAQPKNNKMGIRDRTIMILLYDSAARLAEILNLQLTDIYTEIKGNAVSISMFFPPMRPSH